MDNKSWAFPPQQKGEVSIYDAYRAPGTPVIITDGNANVSVYISDGRITGLKYSNETILGEIPEEAV